MSLMTRRRQTCLAWLGLFAMLMVFVGPLISQSQDMLDNHGSSGDPSSVSGYAGHHDAQSGMAMHDEDALAACGYCTLFSHVPGIDPISELPSSEAVARPHAILANVSNSLQQAGYFRFSPRAPPPPPRV